MADNKYNDELTDEDLAIYDSAADANELTEEDLALLEPSQATPAPIPEERPRYSDPLEKVKSIIGDTKQQPVPIEGQPSGKMEGLESILKSVPTALGDVAAATKEIFTGPSDKLSKEYTDRFTKPTEQKPIAEYDSASEGLSSGMLFGGKDELLAYLSNKPYDEAIKEIREDEAKYIKANPDAYKTAELVGGLLPMLAPGGQVSRLSRIGGGAFSGGIEAALRSESEAKAELAQEIVTGAGIGATGGALPDVIKYGRKAIKWIRSKFGNAAASQAEKALGLDKKAQLRRELEQKLSISPEDLPKGKRPLQPGDIGREALEEGLLGVRATKTKAKVKDYRKQIGKQIGDEISAGQAMPTTDIAEALNSRAKIARNAGEFDVAMALEKQANNFQKLSKDRPLFTASELQVLRTKEGKKIGSAWEQMESKESAKKTYDAYREAIKDSLPENRKELFERLNQKYQEALLMEKGAETKIISDKTKTPFTWGNLMLGTALATQNPLAASAALIRPMIQKHGNALAAKGLHNIDKVLGKNPAWSKAILDAGEKSGAAGISAAHFHLLSTDPKYREEYKKLEEKENNE